MKRFCLGVTIAFILVVCQSEAIEKCKGEGSRYGDYKCNHDETHRGESVNNRLHGILKRQMDSPIRPRQFARS